MRLLVLGGTRFLGRGVVSAALAAGDTVTTFSRGESGPPPDGAEALHGDRTSADGLAALAGRDWDAVVDTSGYVPRVVGESARLLADHVGHYVFVSTVNVYPDWPAAPITADSAVHDCPPDETTPDGQPDRVRYGPLKAGCERAVDQHFAGRSTHVRAGLIVGPYDDSGRLPWWISRVRRGGPVLAPGDPARQVRVVDARDLGAWCVHCGREGVVGAFPATGPVGQITFAGVLEACRRATGSDAAFDWVPDDFLVANEVREWSELPLWAPADELPGLWDQDSTGAERAGLRCRPVPDTIADTAAWLGELDGVPRKPEMPPTGLDPAREAELLARWHAGQSAGSTRDMA